MYVRARAYYWRMSRMVIALVVAAVLSLSGCGSGDEDPAPTSSGPLPLAFDRAGGITISAVELRVEADGSATLRVEDSPEPDPVVEFTLDERELEQLTKLLDANPISSFPEPGPESGCADCYTYGLSYGGETYEANDVTLGDDASAVIGKLGELILDHEAPPAAAP